jgi:hypothetical protein
MSCCGQRSSSGGAAARQRAKTQSTGQVASADSFLAAANPRYLVVARQTSTDGKRFSTLTAAQDYARRSGGIIRQL